MRLAMLGPYPIDPDADKISGGVQAVIVSMVKGLARFRDLEIHVVTASPGIAKEKDFMANGIRVYAVPLDKRFGNVTFYSNTRKRICRKIWDIKPDIVHSHTLGYYTLAGLDTGHNKLIVSTHGLSTGNWHRPSSVMRMIRDCSRGYISNKCARMAKRIIVNSPYTKKYLAKFKKTDVYELNNPVADVFFDADNNTEEKDRVLFVGNVCEEKGVMTVLKAIAALKQFFPGIRLMIAGPIVSKDFYFKASRFIKERGLSGCVNFLGSLSDIELKEEYQKAAIFAFPSRQDIAPVALLQAMAGGKAIVATRVGGIPYIIDEGKNGVLIEKNDHKALSGMISLFMKDGELRRNLGANAREKVFKENRISVVAEKLYKIYNETNSSGSL